MTPTQREAAERLADELSRPHCDLGQQEAAALLRELLAEPVQEPVAWLVMDESGYVQHAASWRDAAHEHINDAINEYDLVCARKWRVVPVYAHPPQQRKPLSDEQVYEAISDQVFWATSKTFILRVVRDVERAHGIGEAA